LKDYGVKKYVKLPAGESFKYEVFVTELRTQELLNKIKEELSIHAGKGASEGYITVNPTNLVAPVVVEKGKEVELDELIMKGAKKFIKLDRNYILFIVCSTIAACIGFQMDNMIILIGAMIINPLMSPIMAASYGMSKTNRTLIGKGLKSELLGISLIILVSLVMSLLPNNNLGFEKTLASADFFLILLLSIAIGLVAANSFITGSFEALTGVAVGISLLPPLTNFVMLVAQDLPVFAINSLFSFTFNILGMHLSALVWFLIIRKLENKKNNR